MKISGSVNMNKVMKSYQKSVESTAKATGVKRIQDKIEISDAAREVQVATQAFKELPEVRQDLVDRLKVAIKEGTYKPSSEDIARKMFSIKI